MPTPNAATLQVVLNGGAPQTGVVAAAFADSVVLKLADPSGVKKVKYRIYEYPEGFACPAGWTAGALAYELVVANGAPAPAFALPASDPDLRGQYLFSAEVNNRTRNGAIDNTLYDNSTLIEIPFTAIQLKDCAYLIDKQADSKRGWAGSLKRLIRYIDQVIISPGGTGDVVGPGSAVSGRVATFNGGTGKNVADGGIAVSDMFANFNVKLATYGASPAALAAANRVAIQAALTAANAAGAGLVYIPDGLGTPYLVDGAGGNIALSLTGLARITLRGAGPAKSIIRLANAADSHLINIDGATDLQICDLTLDGNRANQTLSVHGLRIGTAGVLGLKMRNVEVKECFGYGVGLQGGTKKRIDLSSLYVHDTGSDCIDLKNTDDDAESIVMDRLILENFGLNAALTVQAGLDIRGPAQVSNVWVKTFGRYDCQGVRARDGALLGVSGYGGHRSHFSNIHVVGGSSSGGTDATIGLNISGEDVAVEGGRIEDCFRAVSVIAARATLTAITAHNTIDDAFLMAVGADDGQLFGCHATGGDDTGFRIRAPRVGMYGCTAKENVTAALATESGALGFEVHGFKFQGTGGSMVGIDIGSDDALIVGGTGSGCFRGISTTGDRTKIKGTTVSGSLDDNILVASAADDALIDGVTSRTSADAGVRLRGDRAKVVNCVLDTNDKGLAIEATSDRTYYEGNTFTNTVTTALDDSGTNSVDGGHNDGVGGLVASSLSEDVVSAASSANVDISILASKSYLFRVKVTAEDSNSDRGTKIVLIETRRSVSAAPSTPTQVSLFTSGDAAQLTINNTISGNNLRLSVTNGMGHDAHLTIKVNEVEREPTVEDS